MITADQLVAHAIGDYVLQSDWMANLKRKENGAAVMHALAYSLCFVPFLIFSDRSAQSAFAAAFVIFYSHFLIDRYGLARYVVFAKNFLSPRAYWPTWADSQGTGYPSARPPWLAVWLLIIADNVLHVVINGLALAYL